ncbi:MAG: winged helix-turn-helix domain-containing protein [Candidatus Saccharimonadales bacterium]
MIEQLFGSKTRVKLLQLFYSNPNRSFYVREITRKIDEQINSVRRELSNLLNAGIISSETTNNRLYYEINKTYQFYDPLLQIFGAAEGVTGDEETNESLAGLKALGNIDLALYTGQFTRDEKSGVDFVVVGDINTTQLSKYVADMEAKEGKAIRYVFMDKKEFEYRRQVNDRFLLNVLDSKKQIVINKAHLLEPQNDTANDDDDGSDDAKAVTVAKPTATKKAATNTKEKGKK